jgi:hypothetical protein
MSKETKVEDAPRMPRGVVEAAKERLAARSMWLSRLQKARDEALEKLRSVQQVADREAKEYDAAYNECRDLLNFVVEHGGNADQNWLLDRKLRNLGEFIKHRRDIEES